MAPDRTPPQADATLVQLAFRLFDRMRAHGHARASEFGLTPNEAGVLLNLDAEQPGPAASLAVLLGHDMGNLTRLLARLESRGLLQRKAIAGDRWVRHIVLTPQGRELQTRLRCRVLDDNPVVAGLDEPDVGTLRRLLERIDADASTTPTASATPNRADSPEPGG